MGFCEEVSVYGLGGVDIFDPKGGGIDVAICFEGCRFCAVEGKLGWVWALLCRNMLGSGYVKGVSLEYKGFFDSYTTLSINSSASAVTCFD